MLELIPVPSLRFELARTTLAPNWISDTLCRNSQRFPASLYLASQIHTLCVISLAPTVLELPRARMDLTRRVRHRATVHPDKYICYCSTLKYTIGTAEAAERAQEKAEDQLSKERTLDSHDSPETWLSSACSSPQQAKSVNLMWEYQRVWNESWQVRTKIRVSRVAVVVSVPRSARFLPLLCTVLAHQQARSLTLCFGSRLGVLAIMKYPREFDMHTRQDHVYGIDKYRCWRQLIT